jgi:hypothetical protein
MKTVLITGGIGSGKSEVCKILKSEGIPVYDTDYAVKTLYNTNSELVKNLERSLDIELVNKYGKFDFSALSKIIFSSKEKLDKLESIIYPVLLEDIINWKNKQHTEIVVLESAIMMCKPLFNRCYDYIILVDAPKELRIERVKQRNNCSTEQVLKRIEHQNFNTDRKIDAVIYNDSDFNTLKLNTESVFKNIIFAKK